MTHCSLLSTARKLCTGLGGEDTASQLNALTALRSWLEASLPATHGPLSDGLARFNLCWNEDYVELEVKATLLNDVPEFLGSILKLLTSTNMEIVAAAARILSLYTLPQIPLMNTLAWFVEAVVALVDIVRAGPAHPAFYDTVDSLKTIAGVEVIMSMLHKTDFRDLVLDMVENTTHPKSVREHVQWLLVAILGNSDEVSTYCVNHKRIESICVSTVLNSESSSSEVMASLYVLDLMYFRGYSTAPKHAELVQRILDLEQEQEQEQEQHFDGSFISVFLLDIILCDPSQSSVYTAAVESGLIDRLITGDIYKLNNGTVATLSSSPVIQNLILLTAINAEVHRRLVTDDVISQLVQYTVISSNRDDAPLILRTYTLDLLATLLSHHSTKLSDADADAIYTAVMDIIAKLVHSAFGQRQRRMYTVLIEAAERLCGCSSRFRALFTVESFCSAWLEQMRSLTPQLASLIHLMNAHLDSVTDHQFHSLKPYIDSGIPSTLAGLIDHPCGQVAAIACETWTVFLDGKHLVIDGVVAGMRVDNLVSLVTQEPESIVHWMPLVQAINSLVSLVDQMTVEQCRQLVTAIIRLCLNTNYAAAIQNGANETAKLLTDLVERLGLSDVTVADGFEQLTSAIQSPSSLSAHRALVLLRQYLFMAKSSSMLRLPAGVLPSMVRYLGSEQSSTVASVMVMDSLTLSIKCDYPIKRTLLDAGIIEVILRIVTNPSHSILFSSALNLLSIMLTHNFDSSIPLASGTRKAIADAIVPLFARNSDTLLHFAGPLGGIFRGVLSGDCREIVNAVDLVVSMLIRVRSLTGERDLAATLEFLSAVIMPVLPSAVIRALNASIPCIVGMATKHRNHVVKLRACSLLCSVFTTLSVDLLGNIPQLPTSITQSPLHINDPIPVYGQTEMVKLLRAHHQAAKKADQFVSSDGIASAALHYLRNGYLLRFSAFRSELWQSLSCIPPEVLARNGFFDYLDKLARNYIALGKDVCVALSFDTLLQNCPSASYILTSSGYQASLNSRIISGHNVSARRACIIIAGLLEADSSTSLYVIRGGFLDAISTRLDNNSTQMNDGELLKLLSIVHQLMVKYKAARRVSPPDNPVHIPLHQLHLEFNFNADALHQRYDDVVQLRSEECRLVAVQFQSLISRLIRTITPPVFLLNPLVSLWQLEKADLIDSQISDELHQCFVTGLSSKSPNEQLVTLQNLQYHLGFFKDYHENPTSFYPAVSEHLSRLLDLFDSSNPAILRATALVSINHIIRNKVEYIRQLLARYPIEHICSLALDLEAPFKLVHSAIITLGSICTFGYGQLDLRRSIISALECFQQLLVRHDSIPFLTATSTDYPTTSLVAISLAVGAMVKEDKFVTRIASLGIINLLFKFTLSDTSSKLKHVAYMLHGSMQSSTQLRAIGYSLLFSLLPQLKSMFDDGNTYSHYDSNSHGFLLREIIFSSTDADVLLNLFVESGIMTRMCQILCNPSCFNAHWVSAFCLFQLVSNNGVVGGNDERSDGFKRQLLLAVEPTDTNDQQPIVMQAAVKILQFNPILQYHTLFNPFRIIKSLFAVSNTDVNTIKMFVDCGGIDACKVAIRSNKVSDRDKLSLLWLLTYHDVFEHDPADLVLGDLSSDDVDVPYEMPSEYDC
ncbi:hypothetical protein GQ42DRAFT_164970 [Ramicandelaber brevisporus]|nr:hypothetical protein GQ42DRAFT_164970 [Ramicandelaber brevisporus]